MAEEVHGQPGASGLPGWVPAEARLYLAHTERGLSIRELARRAGQHASTVSRQVKRTETRRDDPLIDDLLTHLGRLTAPTQAASKENAQMNAQVRIEPQSLDDARIETEARRILRRLCEPRAVLAVSSEMEKAVVMRDLPDGKTSRTAILDRTVAQAMALKDWIACEVTGKISKYRITPAGRAALRRMLAAEESARAGFAEAPTRFADQHREWGTREVQDTPGERPRKQRYNVAESPVLALARRKGPDGTPFLNADLVAAAERLREDFELAQMGPRVTQNWDRFLTAGARGSFSGSAGGGHEAARERVSQALRDLGPGLGDVVLRCCCFLEGIEMAEKRMGWSARSGKVVLRIALERLKRHYDETGYSNLIG